MELSSNKILKTIIRMSEKPSKGKELTDDEKHAEKMQGFNDIGIIGYTGIYDEIIIHDAVYRPNPQNKAQKLTIQRI